MTPALFRIIASILGLLALTACSDPEDTARYLIDPPASGARLPDRLGLTELREVSLPEYASGQEIAWQTAEGAVRSGPGNLWADNPQRSFTLTLARAISDLSGATVISEPWPLAEPPQRRLEVRVEKALAQADGMFRLGGRYFLSDERFGAGGASHARSFDISVPLASDQPAAVAQAMSLAIAQLAGQIATLSGPGRAIATSSRAADSFTMF